ncbi:TPA: response regulator [Legionella pneumophila]|nr:response regulator [Legionella pneumophila]MCW8429458.1 response regulator [Legionella pneumophila]CZG36120.1 two component system sensor kinase SsrA [Legionella pneumophila]CZH42128.1 two component system sensor kinase SsrA [Legionella pneumophila]
MIRRDSESTHRVRLNMDNSLSLLIVNDSLGERICIRAQLQQLNHSVDMAWDAHSGLELAVMKRYDFILIDRNLADGFNYRELIWRIQSDSELNKSTPIVILSKDLCVDKMNQGSETYGVKPITQNDALKLMELLKN